MKTTSVVLGAGYGDEGKGVVTSTLAHDHDLVVRFCGGSQAAHTVNYAGINHVFHHFGSGTLQYKPTYLAEEFIVNPIIYCEEKETLRNKNMTPILFIDDKCRLTTPFDMIINQTLEKKRGDKKHGSCGLGINETVTRDEVLDFDLSVYNCAKNIDKLKDMLQHLFETYYVKRADMLDLDVELFKHKEKLDAILDHYIADFAHMCLNSTIVDRDILEEFDHVLFEGSQGLMLDEEYGKFPHVTRGRTGMTNVLKIFEEHKLEKTPKVFYVTRHYMTRHGEGPIDHEFDGTKTLFDRTNIPNEWQGVLRYGILDVETLCSTLKKDRVKGFKNNIVVTCMDQKTKISNSGIVFMSRNGMMEKLMKKQFLKMINKETRMKVWYTNSSNTKRRLKNG